MGAAHPPPLRFLHSKFQIDSFLLNLRSRPISLSLLPPTLYLTASTVFLSSLSWFLPPRSLSASTVDPTHRRSSIVSPLAFMARVPRLRIDTNTPTMGLPSQNPPVYYPRKVSRHETVHRYDDWYCLKIRSRFANRSFKVDTA